MIISLGVNIQPAGAKIHTYDCAGEIAKTEKMISDATLPPGKRDKAEAALRHGMKLLK